MDLVPGVATLGVPFRQPTVSTPETLLASPPLRSLNQTTGSGKTRQWRFQKLSCKPSASSRGRTMVFLAAKEPAKPASQSRIAMASGGS